MRRRFAVLLLVSIVPATRVARAESVQPVVQNERPARFLLTGGGVVVGTKVSEDAEFYVVQTSQGVVRVRKTDVASIDFGNGGPAAPPVVSPVAQPTPAPAPAPVPMPVDDRYPGGTRRGDKLLSAGLWTFVGVYIAVAMTGAIISVYDADANWMLVPIAGPMLYYHFGELQRNVFGILLLTTIIEGAAGVALLVGATMVASDGGSASAGLRIAEGIDLSPVVGPEGGGMVLGGVF